MKKLAVSSLPELFSDKWELTVWDGFPFRQCELLGIARSSLYYQPQGEPDENLAVMRRINELYTKRALLGPPVSG